MSRPRSCPNCHEIMRVDRGYHFDEALNLICDLCGKIAYPAVETEPAQGQARTAGTTYQNSHNQNTGRSYGGTPEN